jgi:hypothetical protein
MVWRNYIRTTDSLKRRQKKRSKHPSAIPMLLVPGGHEPNTKPRYSSRTSAIGPCMWHEYVVPPGSDTSLQYFNCTDSFSSDVDQDDHAGKCTGASTAIFVSLCDERQRYCEWLISGYFTSGL